MKTSNKILVGTGLLFITLILIIMIIIRLILGTLPESGESYYDLGPEITTNYNFSDFKKIEINDNWSVTIRQGNQFGVEVTVPQSIAEKVEVEVVGDRLTFTNDSFMRRRGRLEALVTMPSIDGITSEDVAQFDLDDFTCDRLQIKLDGACKVRARNNVITNLDLKCTGATHADLAESVITNANVRVTGASHIELNMNGGDLTGVASGAAKIVYYGTVNTEKIRSSGAVSIRHRD